ncbi:hypothetical protein SLEP1_g2529 [Rubroshorea leprosula]|uniref:Secreted protein n=1 Tax=Rubroshorea leprosula TaxID=152421 RepID=A0AAV5HR66_9ROSI|nr:hypothetical protein SLEP1_g2529 [Rubroshorea leprosula]
MACPLWPWASEFCCLSRQVSWLLAPSRKSTELHAVIPRSGDRRPDLVFACTVSRLGVLESGCNLYMGRWNGVPLDRLTEGNLGPLWLFECTLHLPSSSAMGLLWFYLQLCVHYLLSFLIHWMRCIVDVV